MSEKVQGFSRFTCTRIISWLWRSSEGSLDDGPSLVSNSTSTLPRYATPSPWDRRQANHFLLSNSVQFIIIISSTTKSHCLKWSWHQKKTCETYISLPIFNPNVSSKKDALATLLCMYITKDARQAGPYIIAEGRLRSYFNAKSPKATIRLKSYWRRPELHVI